MCFYEFVSYFIRNTYSIKRASNERIHIEGEFNFEMRKRTKQAVVRIPSIQKHTDDYCYSILVLFLPHRHENDILSNNDSKFDIAKEAFLAKHHLLFKDKIGMFSVVDDLTESLRYIRLAESELQNAIFPATTETNETITDEVDDADESIAFSMLPNDP